ncbi:uncharacterized protein UV8b_02532 [Ustilaginoidea virens]|uniref:PinX1-related protein 1 n=1 Tax=Ustilaginoidea virens TaxID=1159556 RepID=A0A8E5MG70_USTVR|nr:uncharacterized protein UV8b_02532 [Ustilaginoidea virens]QUC18291.1 hypothetical protein UV8b_02532 [Ustilaginoidea virens]
MGLLHEKKSRSKISKDPNNTKWTRDTTTFGHRILRSQGWQPGQYLGAQDAAHSTLHTAANASYIRVALKDDMKGLGFDRAKEDEVTGLGVFSDLLSRLNGRSDESIESDKLARMVVKTNRYVEAKWGPMRFVKGGLLVGDDMRHESAEPTRAAASEAEAQRPDDEKHSRPSSPTAAKSKKRKKRKAAADDGEECEPGSSDQAAKEKKRRKKDRGPKKPAADGAEDDAPEQKARAKRASSKDKARSDPGSGLAAAHGRADSKSSKKGKKTRKDCAEADAVDSSATTPSIPTSATATGTSTPAGTGTSTPLGGRNFVRSRFIAQKRQAVLDTKALAQIFMVKT